MTVVEVTATVAILSLVLVATLTTFISAQRTQAYVSDRTLALADLRTVMNRMTKEIRQATSVDASSGVARIDMQTYVNGTAARVVWEATGTSLRRSQNGAAAVSMLGGLTTTSVFTFSPSVAQPLEVDVLLRMRPRQSPNTTLELRSEVRLRNRGTGV